MIEKTADPAAAPAPAPVPAPEPAGDLGKQPKAKDPLAGILPDKYKSADEWRRGYDNLSSMVGKTKEEITAALRPELETTIKAELYKERPEAADKYELPKEGLPPQVDTEALAKHPLVEWWRAKAFDKGLSQAEFQEGIANYTSALAGDQPDPAKELAALGENGKQRLNAVNLWVNKTFTEPGEFDAIAKIGTTAAGIKALEKLMKGANQSPDLAGGVQDTVKTGDSIETIKSLMNSPAYFDRSRRDPAVVKRVEDFWKAQK